MPHMHGLGDIGAAEIDHRRLAVVGRDARLGQARQRRGACIQGFVGQIEIEKSGPGNFHSREDRFLFQPGRDLFGDGAGIGFS